MWFLKTVLILLGLQQHLAAKFEWSLQPSIQYTCVGGDMILHWKYKTEIPVNMVLLQSETTTLTLVECHNTAMDKCFVYEQFRDRVKVLEMVQGSAQFHLLNLNTSDSGGYTLQLLGPDATDIATVYVISDHDLGAEVFMNNELVSPNSSYSCSKRCDSISILVKTHMSLHAMIGFYDDDANKLMLNCTNHTTCVYTHTPRNEKVKIKVLVNYGFCKRFISYLDIATEGAGLSPAVIAGILSPFIVVLMVVIVFLILYKFKKLQFVLMLCRGNTKTCSDEQDPEYQSLGLHENQKESEPIVKSEIIVERSSISQEKNNQAPDLENVTEGRDWTPDSEMCSNDQEKKNETSHASSLKRDKDQYQNPAESLVKDLEHLHIGSPSNVSKPPEYDFTGYRERKSSFDTSDDQQMFDDTHTNSGDSDESL